jgi:hypothetical protein
VFSRKGSRIPGRLIAGFHVLPPVGPPSRQREQLAVLIMQMDPVLTPVLAVRDELEVLAGQRMDRCVTRIRRYRSSG